MKNRGTALRIVTFIIVVAMMAMMMSGCGGAKGASASGGSVTTVKIGVGAPLTAGAVEFGKGLERGTKLAVEQANESERAKKLGIRFEVVSGDDQGDPKTGVTVANQFVSDPAVIGVMGHLNSGVTIPASKVYYQNNIVMIAPASTNPALTQQGYKNVFRVCTIDDVQGSFAGNAAAKDLGFKKAFVVDDSTPYGEGLAKVFAQTFKSAGATVVGQEKTSDKDTDFNALVTKIKAADADVVYYGGLYNAGALLAKQLRESGSKAAFFGGDGLYDNEFVKLAGADNAVGAFSTCIGLPLDKMPKAQEFKTAYEKTFAGAEIAAYDAYAYDAANVIIDAAYTATEKLGAPGKLTTSEGKQAIIAAVAATNSEGVTGKLAFDSKGDTLNKAITLYTVKDGAWTAYSK